MTVSLVTGAGSGIGAATAKALARRGSRVVCVDLVEARAEAVAATLDGAISVGADVTNEDDCDRMVLTAVDSFGDLDVVVTCAGIEIGSPALDINVDTFRRIVDVSLTGSFLTGFGSGSSLISISPSTISTLGAAASSNRRIGATSPIP